MRASRASGRADLTDGLSDPDLVANFDVYYGHVAVAGGQSIPVIALPAGDRHSAIGGGAHGVSGVAAQVDARMNGRFFHERIHAHAEWRAHVDLADDRFAHRHS